MTEKEMAGKLEKVANLLRVSNGIYMFGINRMFGVVKNYLEDDDHWQVVFDGFEPEQVIELFEALAKQPEAEGEESEAFTEGELFVYTNGDRWELGMVKRPNRTGDGYFCWYSTGDTAANTPTRCMHKLANSGYTKVESTLGRGTCHMRLVYEEEDADGFVWPDHYECSVCGANVNGIMPSYDTEIQPRYCPSCGRKVVD